LAPARNIGAVKHHPAARLRQHACERANERRLAGAVRAHDGHDRTFLDVERHRVERLHVAVEYIEIFNAQHRLSAFRARNVGYTAARVLVVSAPTDSSQFEN
jgi:hypothetical protein